jgi:hypothetical protein
VGGFKQTFRGNAAAIQTRAAQLVFFNEADFRAELAGPNRRDISARSRSDNYYVILFALLQLPSTFQLCKNFNLKSTSREKQKETQKDFFSVSYSTLYRAVQGGFSYFLS